MEIKKDKTALVVIDLQKGIVGMGRQLGPHSAEEVVGNASKIANACRGAGIPVFLVHVKPTPETALHPDADSPMAIRDLPENWAEFVEEIKPQEKDIVITKHQWGAFYGTPLDMQLRRMGINTIILCGISTNIGVESTARFAFEYGYNQIFPEDAMTAMNEKEHEISVNGIFKRMGTVKSTEEVLNSIKSV